MNAVTKRQILALTQTIFDPIGFVSPTTLIPKLMLQQLWKDDLTWDQPVTEDLAQKFMSWIKELHYLQQIEIPRWVMAGTNEAEELSLHTFCDASQSAYACVVFLRAVRGGKVSVFLLGAKARISPICKSATKMTIPRLELLAATIGVRLYPSLVVNFEQEVPCFFLERLLHCGTLDSTKGRMGTVCVEPRRRDKKADIGGKLATFAWSV